MVKNNYEIFSVFAFFAFLTPKMTSKFKFDLIRPTQFGRAQAFWFYDIFHTATPSASSLSASNLPFKILLIFLSTPILFELCETTKTLWKYQNFVKLLLFLLLLLLLFNKLCIIIKTTSYKNLYKIKLYILVRKESVPNLSPIWLILLPKIAKNDFPGFFAIFFWR